MSTPVTVSPPASSPWVATKVSASGLARRLTALDRALALCEGRFDDEAVAEAKAVCVRAGERLRLSGEHTVVALAGATGSGKSSLFNSIAGLGLSRVGVRRPTTAYALACAWGSEGVSPLLDWLGIPRQHQLSRETVLDKATPADLDGLVLLDLPDHDSTEVEHRIEVDRLVKLVDLLIWVMDPQKYADAVVHEGYLRPLATHAAVTLVVFNQVDRLSPGAVQQCLADLKRLLAEDGLGQVRVLATSAETGVGLAELRRILAGQVKEKRAAGSRLTADVIRAASALAERCGDTQVRDLTGEDREQLISGLAVAAGVPAVVDAVFAAHRHRSVRATGWPFTRWVRRRHPDPLTRLWLDRPVPAGEQPPVLSQATRPDPKTDAGEQEADAGKKAEAGKKAPSQPVAQGHRSTSSHIQQAQLETALRRVADQASGGLPTGWAESVRSAARSGRRELPVALDRSVAETDLGMDTPPRWWRIAKTLHTLFFVVAVVGGVWLVMLALVGFLQLPDRATPELGEVPLPTAMLVGGALAGAVFAWACRPLAAVGARRRAARAESRLYAGIAEVADRLVLAPVAEEQATYRQACEHLGVAAFRDGDARRS